MSHVEMPDLDQLAMDRASISDYGALRAERDELLAALILARQWMYADDGSPIADMAAREQVRVALAKATSSTELTSSPQPRAGGQR